MLKLKRFTNSFESRIRDYCDANYEKIVVTPGDLNDYSRCSTVATHYAFKNGDARIAVVMYKHQDDPYYCIHFVNYHDGKFIDNSIGWRASFYDYRLIRWLNSSEFTTSASVLLDLEKFFQSMATRLEKLFGDTRV